MDVAITDADLYVIPVVSLEGYSATEAHCSRGIEVSCVYSSPFKGAGTRRSS